MSQNSIVIVSVFGRGHSLAAALKKSLNCSVSLIDLSEFMGNWSMEEIEGPFGFFKSEKLSELQLARLNADDSFVENSSGFVVWFKNQVLELKSALTTVQAEKLFMDLHGLSLLDGKGISGEFSKSWGQRFFSTISRTSYYPSAANLPGVSLYPGWTQPFFVRQVTRQGLDKNLRWLEEQGVQVLRKTNIIDVATSGSNEIHGLELSGAISGLYQIEQLVWCLSSEETEFYSTRLLEKIFAQDKLESQWCWLKYRIAMENCRERSILPLHWVLVDDVEAPWTHENAVYVQRTAADEFFDCWMRLPTVQRFNKEYISSRGKDLESLFHKHLSASQARIHSYPQEYYYTYSHLGAPRYPVYRGSAEFKQWKNVSFSSPETWDFYGWDQILLFENKVISSLENWWKLKLQKEAKQRRHQGEHP